MTLTTLHGDTTTSMGSVSDDTDNAGDTVDIEPGITFSSEMTYGF